MTGLDLKGWMDQNKKSREEIAFRLGITTNTLFRWFKKNQELDTRTVLSLAQLGFNGPKADPSTRGGRAAER